MYRLSGYYTWINVATIPSVPTIWILYFDITAVSPVATLG